jgi:hypothetical protein
MGGKYEILYYDWLKKEYVSQGYTESFFKAMRMVRKLEKTWHCVAIKFRRNKVRINTDSWTSITMTPYEDEEA